MQPFIKQQKIIKVGNSYAVTLDSKFIDKTGLKVNEPIMARYHDHGVSFTDPNHPEAQSQELTKEEQQAYLMAKITPEFQEWVDKSIEEDKESLEKLANL